MSEHVVVGVPVSRKSVDGRGIEGGCRIDKDNTD